MDADFNAFYIFNHRWHHFMTSGIGLRQFCDWMLFLHKHKDEIDLGRLEKFLMDMDMMKPWQSFGCVIVDVLGMPEEEFPSHVIRQYLSTLTKGFWVVWKDKVK